LLYSEYKSKKQDAENKLFTHAKFQYCIDNYFSDYFFGNETYMAGLLISMLANICNKLKLLNLNKKIPTIRNTKLYNYIKEANLEQGIDISTFSKRNLSFFIELIFNHIVNCIYEGKNSVTEPVLVIKDGIDKSDFSLEQAYLDISVIDEDTPLFEQYKSNIEEKVNDWLTVEMHTLPDGRIFG